MWCSLSRGKCAGRVLRRWNAPRSGGVGVALVEELFELLGPFGGLLVEEMGLEFWVFMRGRLERVGED